MHLRKRPFALTISSETSDDLTLKMASAQVVETSVTNNSPSQDSNHPDDLFQSRYVTPGLQPFSYNYTAESLFAGDNTDLEKKFWCFACTLCARDILRQFHCVSRISLCCPDELFLQHSAKELSFHSPLQIQRGLYQFYIQSQHLRESQDHF